MPQHLIQEQAELEMLTHRLANFCTKLPICPVAGDQAVRFTLSRSLPAKSTNTSLPKRLMWAGSAALPGRPPSELLRELPVSMCSVITQWLRDEHSFKRCALHFRTVLSCSSEAQDAHGLVASACGAEAAERKSSWVNLSGTGAQPVSPEAVISR